MPTLLILFHFTERELIPINAALILTGTLSGAVLGLMASHPKFDKPLINFDVILIILPALMLGSKVRTMLNVILPSWMLMMGAVLFLFNSSF